MSSRSTPKKAHHAATRGIGVMILLGLTTFGGALVIALLLLALVG